MRAPFGALGGLKVVDFGHYVAGPLLGMLLADQGAEVLKVEPPEGDRWRAEPSFGIWNRGKRSVVIDLKTAEGAMAVLELLKVADVVIENFGAGVAERLGIDYAAIREINPAVVYCSLPAGRVGERDRDRPGWETLVSAETSQYQPASSATPVYSPLPLASTSAAAIAANAVAAALVARQRFGVGQRIEVPLSRAVLNVMGRRALTIDGSDDMDGWHYPRLPISGDYQCQDGRWFHNHASFTPFVGIFLSVAGHPGWIEEASAILYRAPNPEIVEVWRERFSEIFMRRTSWEWEEAINAAGGAGCVCRTVDEWISSEHVRRSGLIVEVDDPVYGRLKQPGIAVDLQRTPGGIRSGAPRLGEHTVEEFVAERGWAPGVAVAGESGDLPLPLAGIRVLDLCIVLAGPTCGRMLADFGADVIKINDPSRDEEQYQALDVNRGKRSILLDLKTDGGREVFWKLVETADVVIGNFRPGKAEVLGVSYEQLRRRKPEIVYASMNAWGYGGEWSDRAGWEPVAQSFSGMSVRFGGRDRRPAHERYPIDDYTCGVLCAYGVIAALLERFRSGRGQSVRTSLAAATGYLQARFMFDYPGYVRNEPEGHSLFGESALSRLYRTADDRYLFLEAATPDARRRLSCVDGFATLDLERGAVREDALAAVFRRRSLAEWTDVLERAGVGVGVSRSFDELLLEPDLWASGALVEREHTSFGQVRHVGVLPLLSRTPASLGRPAPAFGADSREILHELGYNDKEVDSLSASGAVDLGTGGFAPEGTGAFASKRRTMKSGDFQARWR